MKPIEHPPHPVRFAWSTAIAAALVCAALSVGVLGYHFLNQLDWIDALVDASMILGGMGPVSPLRNDAAKIFAAIYALFSGIVFLAVASILLAPWVHRFLHRLHADRK